MQTSFLTPPFGFALFYLRSVAAKGDYQDRVTGRVIPAVTTGQIYRGSIAFIVLQLVMVACVIASAHLVVGDLHEGAKIEAGVEASPPAGAMTRTRPSSCDRA